MPTYICTKCGCIDNSACGGNYWNVVCGNNGYKDAYANINLLCVECTPKEYCDNSINDRATGKWHDIFPKRHWSVYGDKESILSMCDKQQGNFANAVEYFKNLKTMED